MSTNVNKVKQKCILKSTFSKNVRQEYKHLSNNAKTGWFSTEPRQIANVFLYSNWAITDFQKKNLIWFVKLSSYVNLHSSEFQ